MFLKKKKNSESDESMNKDISAVINPDFDFILEEGANSAICCRKISWNGRPEKVDIRKCMYNDGKEIMGKGVCLSDAAANELACVLVENAYGDTDRLLKAIKNRPDYNGSEDDVEDVNEEVDDDEFYDSARLLDDDSIV